MEKAHCYVRATQYGWMNWQWDLVTVCPFCKGVHRHSGGEVGFADPRAMLGARHSHCDPMAGHKRGMYELVFVGVLPLSRRVTVPRLGLLKKRATHPRNMKAWLGGQVKKIRGGSG